LASENLKVPGLGKSQVQRPTAEPPLNTNITVADSDDSCSYFTPTVIIIIHHTELT